MKQFGVADVVSRVSDAAFGRQLVTNVLRGQVVEAIVALALEPAWTWCAADYQSWDFERLDGVRLEVKQSSLRQTWEPPAHGRLATSFDIRARTGRWEGAVFVREPGRAAHSYIFALHDVLDGSADHRNPEQWKFFVVTATDLPSNKRISLSRLKQLAPAIAVDQLTDTVNTMAQRIGEYLSIIPPPS